MKNKSIFICFLLASCVFIFSQCSENSSTKKETEQKPKFGGYESQVKWGEHLVLLGGCSDCHTPKKMSPKGPVDDESLFMSGHPAAMPAPDIDRKEVESKGLVVTQTLTAWVGPWGISYSANLTPDETGIGTWTEANFLTAIKEGKYKGISASRPLMPPMPWEQMSLLSDDELKAMFAYLKSLKPVKNIVPMYQPPLSASK